MKMTEAEILSDYREAKAKNKQIEILADMNLVTKKEMAQFLADHGMQVDKRLLAGDPRKRKEEPVFIPDEPELTEEEEEKFARILDSVDARAPMPARKPLPDQTAKADAGKPRLSLVPMQIMFDIAEIREYGCGKYPDGGPDNWKQVEPDRFVDALLRHLLRFVQDRNSVDAESGKSHLSHAACNMAFLCERYHGQNPLLADDPEVDDGK